MSVSPPTLSTAALVAGLRTAGCVFAEDEARLLLSTARTPAELHTMLDRRVAGVPLEQVLGWAEFSGVRVALEPGVFVPRRRTEFLVRQVVAALARRPSAHPAGERPARGCAVVVDLCCGSGAVAAALLAALDRVECHAADIDPVAVGCARRNISAAGGRVYEGDLFEPLPAGLRGGVDVLVANAPYVPTAAIELLPPEARLHEPRVALDGGPDGLDVQRRVIEQAPEWLASGGLLFVETSERQAELTARAIDDRGLLPRVVTCEELDATVVVGARPEPVAGTHGHP